jgi:hypothetical protein
VNGLAQKFIQPIQIGSKMHYSTLSTAILMMEMVLRFSIARMAGSPNSVVDDFEVEWPAEALKQYKSFKMRIAALPTRALTQNL